MRMYSDITEMLSEIERDLFEMSVIVRSDTVKDEVVNGNIMYDMQELVVYNFTLVKTDNSEEYLKEMLGFSKDNDIGKSFTDSMYSQIHLIIKEIKRHPYSRQLIITDFDRHNHLEFIGDGVFVPRFISIQFLMRDHYLHMIVNIRSCDLYSDFKKDIYNSIKFIQTVAKEISVECGSIVFMIGSLYALRKDLLESGVF